MNIVNLTSIAVKALMNNKLRGFLTMLGIIIGVGSVITMLAIGQGSKKSIQSEISSMGSNMIMISPGGDRRGGVRMSGGDMKTLTVADLESIIAQANYVTYVSPVVTASGQAVYGANNTPTSLYGVTMDYLEIRSYAIGEGEGFTEQDIRSAAKVCIIGKTTAETLFGEGVNPIGKNIRFGSVPFRVCGMLESKGYNSMGQDQDDVLMAPYTTVQKRLLARNSIQQIVCSAISEEYSDAAMEEITAILRANHKLKDGTDNDFNIRSQEEISSMMTSTTNMMTILLAAVAGISLLVGGIGIMNIMYVSVTERTKEIGLRMSIGARGRDILAQFLIESVLISVTGGLIGVLFGIAASYVVKWLANFPISIQAWTVALAFGVCTVTGIFFGWYPARKAAGLDPIEALRYE